MNETQKAILLAYKTIAQLCSDYNIPFFAIGGTALGAVRHKGFIPWDDDLDIAIPVEDYDRFLHAAREGLPAGYSLITYNTSPHYSGLYAKVINENTTFIEPQYQDYPDAYTGVWVDVMPMGGMPTRKVPQQLHAFAIALGTAMLRKSRLQYRFTRSLAGKVLWALMQPIKKVAPNNYFGDRCMKTVAKHPFRSSEYVGYTWCKACNKLIFPRSWFEKTTTLPFEDTSVPCPIEWDKYLTAQFGNYLRLPPKEEQQSHAGYVDLNHSYKEYQTGELALAPQYSEEVSDT